MQAALLSVLDLMQFEQLASQVKVSIEDPSAEQFKATYWLFWFFKQAPFT